MSKQKIRCAIYTRKSTDEGLEQEFNSLDAQYEACAAYIASQKHEGWKLVNKRYDDGGISGGTMERAGLQALLADIHAGLIDMIVVYKIDRLTRSLSDFSKIVDRLDAKGASFVSVTQSFNTATSMGRLTLNMLLSFAQFEREVTAERIRDKIAASKAKGLWMGGVVPLGYDVHPDPNTRSLVVNKFEAKQAQWIFKTYLEIQNLRKLCDKIEATGIRSKTTQLKSGKTRGGVVMGKGAIHHILTNPIYIGKIKHKDKIYDGQHEAIIEQDLWDQVQAALTENAQKPRGSSVGSDNVALLKGKLFDETEDHLTPSHTKKDGRTIRYYISNRLIKAKDPAGWRLPAKTLENVVKELVLAHLQKAKNDMALFQASDIATLQKLHTGFLIDELDEGQLFELIERVDLDPNIISIKLNKNSFKELSYGNEVIPNPDILAFSTPMSIRKRGVESKIVIGNFEPQPNTNLVRTLSKAHQWLGKLKCGETTSEIATEYGLETDYLRKRINLALLSPNIQKAIISGNHPDNWCVAMFVKAAIPLDWQEQEKLFLGAPVIP